MIRKIAQLSIVLLMLLAATTGYTVDATLARVTFLDVHQGDCVLIRTAEKTIMIDAGDDNRSAAQRYIIPYLKKEGIKHIDQVIITHPHRDHFGGFMELLRNFSFGEFIYSNDTEAISSNSDSRYKGSNDDILYSKLRQMILERDIIYRKAISGEKLDWGKGVDAEVIFCESAGTTKVPLISKDQVRKNPNNISASIKMTVGSISYLFTGDAEKLAETKMIAMHGTKLKSTVLKSGHHGSKTSSTHAFMDLVQPEYGVISAGKNNSFGHPTKSVLDIYDYHNMKVFRTDLDGHVESYTDGKTIKFVTDNSQIEFAKKPSIISLTANSATIQWTTNKPGVSSVFYGIGTANKSKISEVPSKVQTVTITGLKPSTSYKYIVEARDPREQDKIDVFEGTITTPAGSGIPLPKIKSITTNYDRLYMKHPFNIVVPVSNPAETVANNISLEVYHSAMNTENLIGKSDFNSIKGKSSVLSVFPTQIDWLGKIEIIAVLRQGSSIIDTASTMINVEAKLFIVDCAHGNKDYYTGRFAGMKMDLLQSLGMQMRSVSKVITYPKIKNAFVLAIPHPTINFKAAELTALKQFVSGGGSLILYGKSDYKNGSNPNILNDVLNAVGSKIRFNDDQFCDPSDNIGPPYRPFVKTFPTPAITGSEIEKLLFRDCGTLISSKMKGLKSSKNLFLLATGDDDSYNSNADSLDDSYIYASHTPLLPIPIVASEDLGSGRIACIGEALYQDSFYTSPSGLDTVPFNRNLLRWLSLSREKSIRELVEYIASLDEEADPEVRINRYEALSSRIIKDIKTHQVVDSDYLDHLNEMLHDHEYSDVSTITSLRNKLGQIKSFDRLHK